MSQGLPPPPQRKRWGCGAATLGQRLYVAGGCIEAPANVLRSVECYDPALRRWTLVKPMRWPRWGHFLASSGGKLFAVGGSSALTPRAHVEQYDPNSNQWSDAGFRGGVGCRWGAACVADLDHHLIVVGGLGTDGTVLSSVEVVSVDRGLGRWESAAPLPGGPRAGHGACYHDGHVYCAGGRGEGGGLLATVERLDVSGSDVSEWQWEQVGDIMMP
jgi:N-acetylneuraminic acid mutarotase